MSSMPNTLLSGGLSRDEISRYSRQLILPEMGTKGQTRLRGSSALVVGAGGLGCPVAVYLAAAGLGKLGIVDYDEVEVSNLHRQILHTENDVGHSKAESVRQSVKQINSGVECVSYCVQLNSGNALDIISHKYDIVVDATDNVPTRYLLNDACVLAKKPLVSGSALRFEGQLTVYNHDGGPCYRCLFPIPPPPESVTNCSDGGVLGPVPGMIGTMQALEVVKMAAGLSASYCNRMLLFDGLSGTFRTVRLRSRRRDCPVCGDHPAITSLLDYETVCGSAATDRDRRPSDLLRLTDDERLACKAYKTMADAGVPHLLVDVREPVEIGICCLPNAYNLPLTKLNDEEHLINLRGAIEEAMLVCGPRDANDPFSVVVVCRRGNDSQFAVRSLQRRLDDMKVAVSVRDLTGGLQAWTAQVDPNFPRY